MAVFAGMSVTPTMIITIGLLEKIVPESKVTERMTWAIAGLGIVGIAAVVRFMVDSFGARAGFIVTIIAGSLALIIALLGYKSLRSAYSHAVITSENRSTKR